MCSASLARRGDHRAHTLKLSEPSDLTARGSITGGANLAGFMTADFVHYTATITGIVTGSQYTFEISPGAVGDESGAAMVGPFSFPFEGDNRIYVVSRSSQSGYVYAIEDSGANVTIQNCAFYAGGSNGQSSGIRVASSSPKIFNNVFHTGDNVAANWHDAIRVDAGDTPLIYGNTFHAAGNDYLGVRIALSAGTPHVIGNLFIATNGAVAMNEDSVTASPPRVRRRRTHRQTRPLSTVGAARAIGRRTRARVRGR